MLRTFRKEALHELRGEPRLADSIPPFVVAAAVLFLVGRLGLQRSVHGDVCEVEEERLVLIVGAEVLDVPDRFVGQIVGEVVPLGVLVHVDHRIVGDELIGIVEGVEAFE